VGWGTFFSLSIRRWIRGFHNLFGTVCTPNSHYWGTDQSLLLPLWAIPFLWISLSGCWCSPFCRPVVTYDGDVNKHGLDAVLYTCRWCYTCLMIFSPGHPQWDEENWSLYWLGIHVSWCYLYSSLLMQSEVFSLMCWRATAVWSNFQPGWTAKMKNLSGVLAIVTVFYSSVFQPPFLCVSLLRTEHLHKPPGTERMNKRNFVLFEVSHPTVLLTI